MSDARARDLERRARAGDPEALAAWLALQLRVGALPREALEQLARLDFAPARAALGDGAPPPLRGWRNFERWIDKHARPDDVSRYVLETTTRGLTPRKHAAQLLEAYRDVLIPQLLDPLFPGARTADRNLHAEVHRRQLRFGWRAKPVPTLARWDRLYGVVARSWSVFVLFGPERPQLMISHRKLFIRRELWGRARETFEQTLCDLRAQATGDELSHTPGTQRALIRVFDPRGTFDDVLLDLWPTRPTGLTEFVRTLLVLANEDEERPQRFALELGGAPPGETTVE